MGAKGDDVDGVLLMDKPTGMSSNWALQLARRLINARKAGHTGTLDPMASGLLPLCFGNATKYSADLLHADKRYLATVRFGSATDTLDAEGEVTASGGRVPTREELLAALPAFTGEIEQTPPMYSAVKQGGRNLYELARKGIEVERKPRRVTVRMLELVDFRGDEAVLDARVSKGTYIRVLAADIAAALGTHAHLSALRRTEVGDLSIRDAVPFAAIDDKSLGVSERRALLQGSDFLLQSLPELALDAAGAARLANGQRFRVDSDVRGQARAYGPGRKLLGVVRVDARAIVHPERLVRAANPDNSQ